MQVPPIIQRLSAKGYNFMTAANCVGDDEPHKRYAELPINAQSANSESKMAKGSKLHADSAFGVQKSSANSLVYSIFMSFVLAVGGFVSYFI
jgi:hypothetical protein